MLPSNVAIDEVFNVRALRLHPELNALKPYADFPENYIFQMADQENDLFAIEINADDYAETAAGDTPSVSRTYQSEADFQAIKASYTAKQDGNSTYQDLIAAVPALRSNDTLVLNTCEQSNGLAKVGLGKKDFQLLGYAAGQMYFDGEYARILELCGRVRERCDVDAKTAESLDRWERRCRERQGG